MVIPNKECFINKDPISFIFINIPGTLRKMSGARHPGTEIV
jgi:hypothetical protein